MLGQYYNVDMGVGNDKFQSMYYDYIEQNNITNCEISQRAYDNTTTIDNFDGWVRQGDNGDCRLYSVINSFAKCSNTGNIKELFNIDIKRGINTNPNGYKVTFNNAKRPEIDSEQTPDAHFINTFFVNDSELSQYTGSYGDLDTILIDIALNKLISMNQEYEDYIRAQEGFENYVCDTSVSNATYNTLSLYLTGSSDVTYVTSDDVDSSPEEYKSRFLECWNRYNSGEISNLCVGITDIGVTNEQGDDIPDDFSLGIVGGHAYALKNVVNTGNDDNSYVELVNPWDDADVLRLSFTKFFSLTTNFYVLGEDIYNQNLIVINGIENKNIKFTQNDSNIRVANTSTQPYKSIPYSAQTVNPFAQTTILDDDIQKDIQDVENKINKAKYIFLSRKQNGEVSA